MKSKIISGIGVDTIGSFIAQVIGFCVVPLYFNYITKEQFGIWLTINGLVSMISIAEVSVDQYLTSKSVIDEHFFSKDFLKTISKAISVKLIITLLLVIISLPVFFFISKFINISDQYLSEAKGVFIIGMIHFCFNIFYTTLSAILNGRQCFSLVNFFTTSLVILISLGNVFYLHYGLGIYSFPISLLSSLLIHFILLFIITKRMFPNVGFKFKYLTLNIRGEMLSYSIQFQITRWLHIFRTQYINIIISNLIGVGSTTIYSMSNRLPLTIHNYSSKIVLPFFPSFTNYFAFGEIEKIKSIFLKVNKLLARISLFSGILILTVNEAFIVKWVSSDVLADKTTLHLLSIYMCLNIATCLCGIVIFASKKYEKWLLFAILEILIAITLSHIFKGYGLKGIIGSFLFAATITQLYLVKITIRKISLNFNTLFFEVLKYITLPSLITFICSRLLLNHFTIDSWLNIIAACSILTLSNVIFTEGYKVTFVFKGTIKQRIKMVLDF